MTMRCIVMIGGQDFSQSNCIMKADESKAYPLSPEEKRIITRIALEFPKEQMIYDAAHKEKIWIKQPNGSIIPYTDSSELTGI